MQIEEDIPLSKEDIRRIKDILQNSQFDSFQIHPHYWLNGIKGIPRHGFELEQLRKIFNQINLIEKGFKRKSKNGFSYTLIYKISRNSFVKVSYFFDERLIKIFNAIPINRNLDKAVSKRYGLRI